MEDKDNKRAITLLNLIADFRIANEQLISKNNDLRMELLAKSEKIGNTLQELREAEKKIDRVVTSITSTIKNGGVITKDDVIYWRDMLEKGDE